MKLAAALLISVCLLTPSAGFAHASDPEAGARPAPAPTPVIDGPNLYGSNCAVCHGALKRSSKGGATAGRIQAAINSSTGSMGSLSRLWSVQVAAIGTALAAVAPAAKTTSAPTADTIYIHDSFTDTNDVLVSDHYGETGSTWHILYGTNTSWIDHVSGSVYSTADSMYWNTGTIPTGDYSVIATVHSYPGVAHTNQAVSGRINTKVHSRYFAGHGSGMGWGLYSADGLGGEFRIGALYGPAYLPVGDYIVELRMVGSTISMYVDGVLAASGTSTLYTTGAAGIELHGAGIGAAYEMSDWLVKTPGNH